MLRKMANFTVEKSGGVSLMKYRLRVMDETVFIFEKSFAL